VLLREITAADVAAVAKSDSQKGSRPATPRPATPTAVSAASARLRRFWRRATNRFLRFRNDSDTDTPATGSSSSSSAAVAAPSVRYELLCCGAEVQLPVCGCSSCMGGTESGVTDSVRRNEPNGFTKQVVAVQELSDAKS
jgi:hypothetical protein